MLIAPDRKEQRLKETISRPFMYLLGSWYKPIHVARVAAVMIANEDLASSGGEASTSSDEGAGNKRLATAVSETEGCVVERWENAQMHALGEMLTKGKVQV
eukprot:TRINITY_DN10904_c0_g1_i2.p2 TRINITY_DN10904_c0_g1~~TRINITY_DN10904_c0_g1_i2.p2  ORF type:complete len:101 (-),score=32.38 TRINITY_DN10904_c0_g1_i2:15-317(-)